MMLTRESLATAAAPFVIGLDVGGTKMAGGVVSFPEGRVLQRQVVRTPSNHDGASVLSEAMRLVALLIEGANRSGTAPRGLGIGVPEVVDSSGTITSDAILHWRDLRVDQAFSRLLPVVIEADVRAAGLAEAIFGSGIGFKLFLYITVGTGISSCLVQDGRPYAGARGGALVLASSPLTMTCPYCGGRVRLVLEDFAAGPALARRYNERTNARVSGAEEVLDYASAGDSAAIQVVRSAGEALGVSVAFLVNTMDPEAVIVGGGLGLADGLYWDSFAASTREHIWADAACDLPLLKAALGVEAGVIGAAAMFVLHRRTDP